MTNAPRAVIRAATVRERYPPTPGFLWTGSLFAVILIPVIGGCNAPGPSLDDAGVRRMVSLLMPNRIRIVQPFTRVASVKGEAAPDVLEVMVQAENSLDDPGLMIVGDLRVELFEHVPASGNHLGGRLEHWDIGLQTVAQQKRHWNPVTQLYEFRLGIDADHIPPADKYVLVVTYRTPLGETLRDECFLTLNRTTRRLQ